MPDTIWPLAAHTEVKHNIYDRYLDAWFPIILRSFKSATYAEGFAGPGVYTGSPPPAGSPIRALRRLLNARRVHTGLGWQPARFVLVEKRRDRFERLVVEFERELGRPLPGGEYRDPSLHIVVRHGECESALPQALTDVGAWDAPILVVLDSFGGGCTRTLLEAFAPRRGCEVLTTVEPQHFVRELDPARADAVFGATRWRAVAGQPADRKRAFIAEELDRTTRAAGFEHVLRFGL